MFYGYVKDSNTERAVTFLLMIMLASLHNLSRTVGTALMLVASPRLTLGLIIGEMFFYHLYKLARRDYVLWVVGVEGALKYLMAFILLTVTKVLVDFTGIVHARGPKLAGGALFSSLTIISQLYPFVALFFYDKSSTIENRMATSEVSERRERITTNTSTTKLTHSRFIKIRIASLGAATNSVHQLGELVGHLRDSVPLDYEQKVQAFILEHRHGKTVLNRLLPGV